tara:strand:- start:62 stop:295 length:234 start_codon:yes stop_codon:yes gene_type:complete
MPFNTSQEASSASWKLNQFSENLRDIIIDLVLEDLYEEFDSTILDNARDEVKAIPIGTLVAKAGKSAKTHALWSDTD